MTPRRSLHARACLHAALFASLIAVPAGLRAQPAFPGAEGFGAGATGGRGGSVYIVTNLNDSGAGSFRDAVSAPNRTVVFAVGGVIRITSRIPVSPGITIAGQTAPGDGITIYGNGVSFSNASNTICRFIRFRQGIRGDSGTDAVGIASGSNMIFDHVSASWGRDETFSVTGTASSITLQDCIVGQGLLIHSAGGLMEPSGPVSVFRSLYVDNWMRNPKVKGTHEFTNNVVYNWGSGGAYICGDSAGLSHTNIVNNLFVAGVDSGSTPAFIRGNLNFRTYAAGNVQDSSPDGTLAAAPVHPNDFTVVDAQPAPFAYPTVARLLTPAQALDHARLHAGASLRRDSVDAGMVAEVLSYGTLGRQIADEAEVGGVGPVAGGLAARDGDADGMPDWWEMAAGHDPALADHNGDANGDGYTNLENYLNTIAYAGVPGAQITAIETDTGVLPGDGNTSDNTLILFGTAVPGSLVTVQRYGVGAIGTTTASGSGTWSLDYSGTTLPDNYHVFLASATYDGIESTLSRGFVVRVDTTPALAPAVTSLVISPEVAFNGTSEPGVAVTVRIAGGDVVASATADGLGNWVAPYTGAPLAPGVYSFTAAAVDLAGNPGPESAVYTVDTGLAPPTFSGIVTDSGAVINDAITNDQTLILNGTAPADSTVSVTRSGVVGPIGSAVASAAGAWTLDTTATTLAAGTYTYAATATVAGNSSPASAPFVVVVDRTAPTIPSILRHDPATPATSSSTLVFRVTWSEPVVNFDTGDLQLTMSGAGMTGTIASIAAVSPSVYDVTVTGAGGDGTIRLDRRANSTVQDLAGNAGSSGTFTGGQSYSMRLPGSSVWLNSITDGVWSGAVNWQGGLVADGSGATADFATLELSEDRTVHLDSPRTLGRVIFGDADISSPARWTLDDGGSPANVLTLASIGTPTIQVNYSGATGDSNATIAAAGAAVPARFDLDLAGTQGLAKAGLGTALLTRPVAITGPLAINTDGGYLRLGAGSSYAPASATIGTSAQLQVAGGTFTTPGTITISNGGQSGVQVYDGVAAIARITTTGDRDGVVKVTGGSATIGELTFPRSSNSESEAAGFSRAGLIIQGGVTEVGTLNIASGNSWSGASIEGGELSVSGTATFGAQVTAGRGALLRVTGGRFIVSDPVHGLVLSKKNGTNANNVVKVTLSGGVTTLEKLTLGFDNTVNAGSVAVTLSGGALYLGAGGLVRNGVDPMLTTVTLASGTLGADADWGTALPMTLSAATSDLLDIRAADEAGSPRVIVLDGVLSGAGGFTKRGAGALLLNGANTYTGATIVAEGLLDIAGAVAGDVTVQGGARLGGIGAIGGSVTLEFNAALAARPLEAPLAIAGALNGDGSGIHGLGLPVSLAAAVGDEFTLATFGSTNLTSADLRISAMLPYRAVPVVEANRLRLRITGVGPTAEFTHWAHLEGLPPGSDGPDDNPSGDGIPNLLKFVLGLDPNATTAEGIAATTVAEAGETYPAIVYVRRKALGGVTTEVRVAPDLTFATLLGAVEVSAADNGDGTETVVARSAVSTAQQPQQFFRIAATLPAAE